MFSYVATRLNLEKTFLVGNGIVELNDFGTKLKLKKLDHCIPVMHFQGFD